ncbi:hypothetical protein Tco_0724392 [Tanacetum coccineum]
MKGHFSPGGTTGALITSTSSSSQPKPVVDWWAEDLIVLRFDIFQRVLYHCDWRSIGGIYASLLLILYFFIGLSVPSAFVLWIMREVPLSMTISVQGEKKPLLLSVTIQLRHNLSIGLLLLPRRIRKLNFSVDKKLGDGEFGIADSDFRFSAGCVKPQ